MIGRALVVAVMVGLSGVAAAQGVAPGQTGIFLGARAGYGIPGGKIGDSGNGDSSNLSDGFTGMVPFALEVGYRVIPHLSLGATLQYGFGIINKDQQKGCSSCSGHDIAFGANVYLHAAPDTAVDPWVGVGLGYERLGISGALPVGDGSFAVASFDGALTGIQFLNLQLGLDFAASPLISVGPFVGVSLGKYSSVSSTETIAGQSMTMSEDIKNTAIHEWVTLGLRCRFNL